LQKFLEMKRALIYTLAGTLISFFINHFLLESGGLWLELFYGFAFGLAWGLAYYLDNPNFLYQKN
jgi:membrane protease YdiL (CAAX protease family)